MNFTLSEEQVLLQKTVRQFAQEQVAPLAAEMDEKEEFHWPLWNEMAELGLTGLPFPEQYGGAEMDNLSYAIACEELGRICGSTSVTLSAHTSLGAWPIYHFGTEEQKERYLKPLALGESLGAMGLTEPAAGSDAAAIKMTARREGDHYRLNGSKIFITNGGQAEIYVVVASTDPAQGYKGISAFIVEKGTPGFLIGKKEKRWAFAPQPPASSFLKIASSPSKTDWATKEQAFA
ncbi:acyl-CoA dehydrogenase [Heliorestis convoluta]|uniref:Acyl-CoA dehydrogenase n=1 Tax=Heliorestis convoluta TaxID=356322 RepID=A0A5Q2MXW4_9FIRM|nr:acyl-CoA dehydrogenase [Heliorestis convoluta]